MSCSTISSTASHKMLSAYFTLPIICPTLKSQNLSTASLVWYLQYRLNKSVTNSIPVYILFQSSLCFAWSSCTLRLWSTYNWLFNLLSCQSVNLRWWHEMLVTRMSFNSMATLNFIKLGSLFTWLWYFRHVDFTFHVLCIRIYRKPSNLNSLSYYYF
jgi:hypothetical protein